MSPSTTSAPSPVRAVVLGQHRRIGPMSSSRKSEQLAARRPRRRRCAPRRRPGWPARSPCSGKGDVEGRAAPRQCRRSSRRSTTIASKSRSLCRSSADTVRTTVVAPLEGGDDDAEPRQRALSARRSFGRAMLGEAPRPAASGRREQAAGAGAPGLDSRAASRPRRLRGESRRRALPGPPRAPPAAMRCGSHAASGWLAPLAAGRDSPPPSRAAAPGPRGWRPGWR